MSDSDGTGTGSMVVVTGDVLTGPTYLSQRSESNISFFVQSKANVE